MANILNFFLASLLVCSFSSANATPQLTAVESAQQEEALYSSYLRAILSAAHVDSLQTTTEKSLFLQAADELSHVESAQKNVRSSLLNVAIQFDSANARLAYAIYLKADGKPDANFERKFLAAPDHSEKTKVANMMIKEYLPSWPSQTQIELKPQDETATTKDLLTIEPDIAHYRGGLLVGKPRVYMLCRNDRTYPCLMVIKNHLSQWQRQTNGAIWSQAALGYSYHHETFDHPNGNTPSGVIRIDGAMPAERPTEFFGKFRRLILNLVETSPNEAEQKKLLPLSSADKTWWHEAVTARNIGRHLFRIHGTGEKSEPSEHYYPFVATSGCVSKRENTYDGIEYIDQKLFLDQMMLASGLEAKPENIEHIRGLLYVINIDSQAHAVGAEDLIKLGLQ